MLSMVTLLTLYFYTLDSSLIIVELLKGCRRSDTGLGYGGSIYKLSISLLWTLESFDLYYIGSLLCCNYHPQSELSKV